MSLFFNLRLIQKKILVRDNCRSWVYIVRLSPIFPRDRPAHSNIAKNVTFGCLLASLSYPHKPIVLVRKSQCSAEQQI